MSLTNAEIRRALKKMRVSSGDVILLKQGTKLAEIESIEQMMELLKQSGRKDIVVIVVDDMEDIRSIPEREMSQHGWYRRERIQSLILRKKPAEEQVEQEQGDEQEENGDDERYELGN